MYATYPAQFEREHGYAEADWCQTVTGALQAYRWQRVDGETFRVELPGGALQIRWQVLAPRRIALIAMPRLQVQYRFDAGVPEAERTAFMRWFDLYTRRGGG